MTTVFISRKHGVAMTDSRGTYDDGTYEDNYIKRWKLDDKRTVYASGNSIEIQKAIVSLKAGNNPTLKTSTIAVVENGTINVTTYSKNEFKLFGRVFYKRSIPETITSSNLFFGTGSEYLYSRVCASVNIIEAFKQTFLQDKYSGGEIRTWKL